MTLLIFVTNERRKAGGPQFTSNICRFLPLAGGSRSFWATQKLAFQQQDEFIIWETTCTKDALKTQSHLFNSLSLFYVITCKWLWRINNFFGNYSNFDDYLLFNSVL